MQTIFLQTALQGKAVRQPGKLFFRCFCRSICNQTAFFIWQFLAFRLFCLRLELQNRLITIPDKCQITPASIHSIVRI